MKRVILIIAVLGLLAGCGSEKKSGTDSKDKSDSHKVVVKEAINASEYTYLRVEEGDDERWLAVPAMEVNIGGTYYYTGGFEMTDFESKELKRKFEKVLFLEEISTEEIAGGNSGKGVHDAHHGMGSSSGTMTMAEKVKDIKVEPAKGGVSIAELFTNKKQHGGKTVKVRGQVVKYTADVMGKNWIHIQDGTESEGKYDLAASSDIEVKVGEIVTLEGKITLDKDIGFGYFYEILMEEAKLVK